MKKNYLKNIVSFFSIFALFFLPVSASAFEMTGGEKYVLPENEAVENDLYIGSGEVDISGDVLGDLIFGTGKATLSGTTTEDVMAAAGRVVISGAVLDDVRVFAGEFEMSGMASSSVIVFTGDAVFTPEAEVLGEALLLSGRADVSGDFADKLSIYGGEVFLNANVSGDVLVESEKLEVGPNANISGNLTYRGPKEASISPEANISGEVVYEPAFQKDHSGLLVSGGVILGFLMLAVGAFAFGLVFRNFSKSVTRRAVTKSFWKYLLLGLAFLVFTPPVIVLLLLTFIGIPLGVLLLFVYGGALIVSWFFASILLGSLIWMWLQKTDGLEISWQGILLGVFFFTVLSFIPVIGWLMQGALIMTALGALLFEKYQAYRHTDRSDSDAE